MIVNILNKNYDAVLSQLMVSFICCIVVILAIAIDLYFGIMKSKVDGKFITHSYGFRKTSEKTVQYLAFMFFMLFLDFLNPIWAYVTVTELPMLSIFGAIVLVYTEQKSVREHSSSKFRNAIKNNPAEIIAYIRENRELINEWSESKKKDE